MMQAGSRIGGWPLHLIALVGVAFICLVSTPVLADEERPINSNEIHELLSNAKVVGKGFEQTFGDPRGHDSASTTYWEGKNSSFGRWRVEANKYCSQWPPNQSWACYKMTVSQQDGKTNVVWIDSSGRRFEGVLQAR